MTNDRIVSGTEKATPKYIEYCVGYCTDGSGDVELDSIDACHWRRALKLVEECEQGLHPDIAWIEKRWSREGEGIVDCDDLYDREVRE